VGVVCFALWKVLTTYQVMMEYTLRYTGLPSDASVFQQFQMHLHKTGSITPMEPMDVGSPQTAWTSANDDVTIEAVA
jgi:hypothetical protein